MNAKKIRTIATSILFALASTSFSKEEPQQLDFIEATFQSMIAEGVGLYLVCYTNVEKQPWGNEWERLEIDATIVDVIRGARRVGDRISFERVLDGQYGDIAHLHGSLHFVRFDMADDGETYIDAQDPQSVFSFSEKLHKIAEQHKKSDKNN